MAMTLGQVLSLVGKLDDAPGEDTPRERFRRFLLDSVTEVGQLRDFIEECLRTPADQPSRALQDLINYSGRVLGFDVIFGRYQGVQGRPGFDGHWRSPSGYHVVVEVKSSETYPIRTATLVGYVDGLISDGTIPDWQQALGLYVVGKPDPQVRQLENAIVAERRAEQLRIISVESLLTLAEMMVEAATHDDILAIVRPSGPRIDTVVDLLSRLTAQRTAGVPISVEPTLTPPAEEPASEPAHELRRKPPVDESSAYWLTPVRSDATGTAEDTIRTLVGEEGIYAFGEKTPGRKHLKPGDWLCFYANGKGVVAHAEVASYPKRRPNRRVKEPEKYPWTFSVKQPVFYFDDPVVIDAELRSRLDAFQGRDPNQPWAWYVQTTRRVAPDEFGLLTRNRTSAKTA